MIKSTYMSPTADEGHDVYRLVNRVIYASCKILKFTDGTFLETPPQLFIFRKIFLKARVRTECWTATSRTAMWLCSDPLEL